MRTRTLILRGLAHYWRTNLAVIGGAAIAVAVLAGAAIVGDSVRGSLRKLFLERIGRTGVVVASTTFFREELASSFDGACPLIALDGIVQADSGRRAYGVAIYGVDEGFWKFHQRTGVAAPSGRDVLLSEALAKEVGAKAGDSLLVRLEKPSEIPPEWLHGRKEDARRSIRMTTRQTLSAAEMGEFSLRPGQGSVRAAFVPLRRLQRDLEQDGKINTLLLAAETSAAAAQILKNNFTLLDLGLRVREIDAGLSVESDAALISEAVADKVRSVAPEATPVFTYVVNAIRANGREVPYSLVTALGGAGPKLQMNEWTATDLGAKPGDKITLDYYVWKADGRLATESAGFELGKILPMRGVAIDRNFAPEYKGMTDSDDLGDWDPPFPIHLDRIRQRDEDYWDRYRTAPKVFIPLERGQQLWQSRFGKLTSIRITGPNREDFIRALRSKLNPLDSGFTVAEARAEGLRSAAGSTDFGEYFLYFSFFLVASALLLVALFFKLGVEQRAREIGLLRALGFSNSRIRRLFLTEGLLLAGAGGAIGIAGAGGYAALILLGLRTWWVDAVGTQAITLHVSVPSLIAAATGGVLTAVLCVTLTLRGLKRLSPRALLAGSTADMPRPAHSRRRTVAAFALVSALGGGAALTSGGAGGFFGAGGLLLIAALCAQWLWLSAKNENVAHTVARLGFRNTTYRPARSVLCISLIAFATFLIVSLDAFRRDGKANAVGYPLVAESIHPVYHDLNSPVGRESANVPAIENARFIGFRLRPGDDASCLNLYQPNNPRVLAAPREFVDKQSDLSWKLLDTSPGDAIPAIMDLNSMTYVLHKKVGDEITLNNGVRLRLAGAIQDSIFQREIVISEGNFLKAFPEQQGFRFFLIDAAEPNDAAAALESALADYGFDVNSTAEQLAGFHKVENAYLSTFQMLGGLGLLLGTAGLAAVLLRNVLESRRQLALLRAVGFRPANLRTMILAENIFLLVAGLAIGAVCASIAIAPVMMARGATAPVLSMGALSLGVLVTGLAASIAAIAVATHSPLLPALRSE